MPSMSSDPVGRSHALVAELGGGVEAEGALLMASRA